MKALSQVVRDWQVGWVLRYQNGQLIQTTYSSNQLNLQLARASPTAGLSARSRPDNGANSENPDSS